MSCVAQKISVSQSRARSESSMVFTAWKRAVGLEGISFSLIHVV